MCRAWPVSTAQGASLRANFPKDAKNHRVFAFLDESALQALIRRGKTWTTKAKTCIQNMQAGRPMSAALLHNLLEEAKSIKLNLSPEVRCTRVLRLSVKSLTFVAIQAAVRINGREHSEWETLASLPLPQEFTNMGSIRA